jgi:glycosyltransferase involved in cell wall biosynthesis
LRNNNTVVAVFAFDPHRIGASEIFARELSAQLGACGWKCVLCFLKAPPEPVRRFLTLPNVSIEVFEDSWKLNAKTTARMFSILRRYRPRILHLNFVGFLSVYPWLAKFLGVEKVFFTDHGSPAEGFVPARAPLWRRAAMRVINAPLDVVISVSRYGYANFVARDLLPKERFHMIYNGVDLARADLGVSKGEEFRHRYHIPPESLVVTQVSWLIQEKGIPDLLTAARQVIDAEPSAHFVLAGDGANRKQFESLARELGITSHTTFTGVVHDPLGEGLYDASDIVCQMSRWEEVFGQVITEAMAAHKPVVGTRVGGIPEVIHDGLSGLLVPRRDTAAMAGGILSLLRDPDLRHRMGEAGRRIVTEKFNVKTNVAQMIQLYSISSGALGR